MTWNKKYSDAIAKSVVKLVLKKARKIISKEGDWCKIAVARTCFDKQVAYDSPYADKWCGTGAINLAIVRFLPENQEAWQSIRSAAEKHLCAHIKDHCFKSFETYNDREETTHKKILKVFDKAIKSL